MCLLVEDGLSIVFSHRSFQEYFTARYIADARPAVQLELLKKYARGIQTDSILLLLYEMKPELVEQAYIIPGLNKLFEDIGLKKSIGITHFLKYIQAAYTEFRYMHGEQIGALVSAQHGQRIASLVAFTFRNCGHLIGWTRFPALPHPEGTVERHYGAQKNVTVRTAELKTTDPFVKELAHSGCYFSIETLKKLSAMRSALIEKRTARRRVLRGNFEKMTVHREWGRKANGS